MERESWKVGRKRIRPGDRSQTEGVTRAIRLDRSVMMSQSGATQGIQTMRNIVIIFSTLAVLCVGVIGTMYIFEARTFDESIELLLKALGAIVLLGGCTALISVLLKRTGSKTDD